MNADPNATIAESQEIPEGHILRAIREIRFGNVEIIVHESRVTEIRQTRRIRAFGDPPKTLSADPTLGSLQTPDRAT